MINKFIKLICAIIFVATLSFGPQQSYASPHFPVKGEMKTRVNFWEKVYTQVTTTQALVHDSEDLSVIYDKVNLPKTKRQRRIESRNRKSKIAKALRAIAKKRYKNLNKFEKKIAKIVGKRSSRELRRMAGDIRYQYGLKDRYYQGLMRSYTYMDFIQNTFENLRLPDELVYLPHVESSFNYHASSKVGAAGMWQFMRGTARLYKLKVNYVIDERRDPFKSTKAAARMLKDNYRILKSWPLALTAYNHGPNSVRRAVKKLKTKDINKIVENYNGSRFGFASKNFYATFMATVNISKNPKKYFPKFKRPRTRRFSDIKLKKPITVNELAKAMNLSTSLLREYNPSIRRSAFKLNLPIPKGFTVRLPSTSKRLLAQYRSNIDKIAAATKLSFDKIHIVSRRENLSQIANSYRVSMNDIIRYNNITNPSLIFAGMKLKIPSKTPSKVSLRTPPKKKKKVRPVLKAQRPKIALKSQDKNTDIDPLVSLESYNLDLDIISRDIYSLTIETQETLGHYAEWANIPTQSIRDLNRMRYGQNIHLGQRIKIKLNKAQVQEFKKNRNEYHVSIQEDFYSSFKITGQKKYIIRRGDTLNSILRKYDLPFWLIRKSQSKKSLSSQLMAGQKIIIPQVTSS